MILFIFDGLDEKSDASTSMSGLLNNVKRCLVMMALACTLTSCQHRMSWAAISNGPLRIDSDWVEVPLTKPLSADWSTQIVRATVGTKFEASIHPMGLRLQDGTFSTPEIDLVTEGGIHQVLDLAAFENSDILQFESDRITRGTRFVRLRMRSSRPLLLSNITWISYMPEDTKTGNPD
jgi:hypothetical protein